MNDSQKLRLLADWFDLERIKILHSDDWGGSNEVQLDLRAIADRLEPDEAWRSHSREWVNGWTVGHQVASPSSTDETES